ncbi:MAG: FumA C-terminus/TtdB family hydratase beta subunit [Oscillospiraceae bacterium]
MKLNANELREAAPSLRAGQRLLLSGTVYTARDAAHARIAAVLDSGEAAPFPLGDAVIYYAGPTPTPEGMPIGSCGPTTSGRMDGFTPRMMDLGVVATIGKGKRSQEVVDAIVRNRGVYLCALGGAGALAAASVASSRVIAYEDLGCESVKQLELREFPLIVGIDSGGNILFT